MGDRSPELSIIIPVYNVDKWLDQCLDSVKQQTYTDFECILVDDGSTDFSGIMCDSYAKTDPRFIVIHQENAGVSAARNAGLDIARGSLLSFIDPDDFISPDYYKNMVSQIYKYNADVSNSLTYFVNELGNQGEYTALNQLNEYRRKHILLLDDNNAVQDAICLQSMFSFVCWEKVFTAKLWGTTLFPCGIDFGEDLMTVPRVIIAANRAVFIPNAVYYWRQRKNSLSNRPATTELMTKNLMVTSEMFKKLCEYAPQREQEFKDIKLRYDIVSYANWKNHNRKKGKTI